MSGTGRGPLDEQRALQETRAIEGRLPADLRVGHLLLEKLVEQRLKRRSGGRHAVACLHPSEYLHEVVVRIVQAIFLRRDHRFHANGEPDLRRECGVDPVEAGSSNPHHLHRMVVHQDLSAHDVLSAAESLRPVPVIEHNDGVPPIDLIVGDRGEHAAGRRPDAERLEVVAGDQLGPHHLRLGVGRNRRRRGVAAEDAVERDRAALKGLTQRKRARPDAPRVSQIRPTGPDHDEALRLGHRQRRTRADRAA